MVDINLIGLELSRDQLSGIMAIYRYIHRKWTRKMYVFMYVYEFPLKHEAELVNDMALSTYVPDSDEWYNINVGTDEYGFASIDFFKDY